MSYGKKYQKKFQNVSTDPTNYRVELHKKDYTGASTDLFILTTNPVTVRALSSEKDKLSVVRGSELIFEFKAPKESINNYADLFEAEYKDWLLKFYNDDTEDLIWTGWVMPENMYREVTTPNITIQLVATDGLKDLAEAAFVDGSGWVYGNQLLSGTEIIKEALKKTGLELNMVIKTNISETTQSATELNLNYSYFNTYRFTGEGRGRRAAGYENIDSCLEVLEKILGLFNCVLCQRGGRYRIFSLHEQNTFEFHVNWDTLDTTRFAAVDIVDVSDYKFRPEPELSMLAPVSRVDVIHRNRNLGTSPIAADLAAWATTWNITYNEYAIDGDRLVLDINEINTGDDKVVELAADFDVSVDSEDPYYLRISFGHWLHEVSDISPYFRIGIKKGGTWAYSAKKFLSLGSSTFTSDNSSLYALPDAIGTHSMNIRILFGYEFNEIPAPSTWNAQWSIRGVDVKKVVVIEGEEGEVAEDITFDTVWRFENDLPAKLNKEYEFIFGDSGQIGDLGAIYVGADADNAVNSTEWKRYGITEAKPLMEIIGKLAVNHRQVYNRYFTAEFKDENTYININSIIKYTGSGVTRHYYVHSYDRDFRHNNVRVGLFELLYDEASLEFAPMPLTMSSVDGHTRTIDSLVLDGGVTSSERSNWNTAYDYSQVGHVETETDPVFNAHVASDITSTNISNWNNAHSERGSQIAGTGLSWNSGEGNLDIDNYTTWNDGYDQLIVETGTLYDSGTELLHLARRGYPDITVDLSALAIPTSTDLGNDRTTTSVTITSSTGTDTTIGAATAVYAGVMTKAMHDKLDGIEAGAEVNVDTNISTDQTLTVVTVESSTGLNADITAVTDSVSGIVTPTQKGEWDLGYSQRGSQIAGTGLTWNSTNQEIDAGTIAGKDDWYGTETEYDNLTDPHLTNTMHFIEEE